MEAGTAILATSSIPWEFCRTSRLGRFFPRVNHEIERFLAGNGGGLPFSGPSRAPFQVSFHGPLGRHVPVDFRQKIAPVFQGFLIHHNGALRKGLPDDARRVIDIGAAKLRTALGRTKGPAEAMRKKIYVL